MKKIERRALTQSELEIELKHLEGWRAENGRLLKSFTFKSFAQALGWMVSVGVCADKLDHHPEWSNVYNRVDVTLTTHDMGNQISSWDIELAKQMDELIF